MNSNSLSAEKKKKSMISHIKLKKIVVFLCFFSIGFNLYSESVFTLDLKKDIVIGAISLGIFFGSFLIDDEPKNIPDSLNKNDVNAFDRWLMFPFDKTLYDLRYIQLFATSFLPIITPLVVGGWNIIQGFDVWLTYGIMYAQAVSLTYGTRMSLGRAIERYRPHVYFEGVSSISSLSNNSFPSGSTALSFLPATFLSVTFVAEYPDSPWKIPVIVGSYTLATIVGITRILSGVHFLTDVIAGAAIGSFYGWLIPTLHKRTNNDDKITFHFTGNGCLISLRL